MTSASSRTAGRMFSGRVCPKNPANDTFDDCRIDYGFAGANIADHVRAFI